jgi:hypothetical protein
MLGNMTACIDELNRHAVVPSGKSSYSYWTATWGVDFPKYFCLVTQSNPSSCATTCILPRPIILPKYDATSTVYCLLVPPFSVLKNDGCSTQYRREMKTEALLDVLQAFLEAALS